MALTINLDDLINTQTVESNRVEFKKGWNPDPIMRTVCAFANDIIEKGGGYIIIGIEEQDGTPVLPPEGVPVNEIDKIQKKFTELCHLLKPKIFPSMEVFDYRGKKIIVIRVTTGDQREYRALNVQGGGGTYNIYVRPNSSTMIATPDLEAKLKELAAIRYFDDRRNTLAAIEDLDRGLILSYLEETKAQLFDTAASLPLRDLCLKMDIARGPIEDIKPLNVGLLMFCKNPEKFFDGCKTNMVIFTDEYGTEYDEMHFTGPVHDQIRAILNYFEKNLVREHVSKDEITGDTSRRHNYPLSALKEVVVNALYHRSFENPQANEIRIYTIGGDPRIEIISYPGPLPPIDREALLQDNIASRNYRHIKLGEWLKGIRLAEKYATGIPSVRKIMRDNGSPPPEFITDDEKSHFTSILRIHPDWESIKYNNPEPTETISYRLSNIEQIILELCYDSPYSIEEILSTNELKNESPERIKMLITKLIDSELLREKIISKFLGFIKLKLLSTTALGKRALDSSF